MPARASWACSPAPKSKSPCAPAASGLMCNWAKARSPSAAACPRAPIQADVDLAMAVKLLSLPREVGLHPEDGKMITANFGRFGPYVAHDGNYASLESPEDVFEIGLNHAVTLLAEKKAKGGGRRGAQALKELGADADGKPSRC